MTLTRKDGAVTALTALVVLVLVANRQGWDVPLVGDSVRWSAVAILLLGIASCSIGADRDAPGARSMWLFGAIGTATLAMAVIALAAASPTALALLALGDVLLWAIATARHVTHHTTPGTPIHA